MSKVQREAFFASLYLYPKDNKTLKNQSFVIPISANDTTLLGNYKLFSINALNMCFCRK